MPAGHKAATRAFVELARAGHRYPRGQHARGRRPGLPSSSRVDRTPSVLSSTARQSSSITSSGSNRREGRPQRPRGRGPPGTRTRTPLLHAIDDKNGPRGLHQFRGHAPRGERRCNPRRRGGSFQRQRSFARAKTHTPEARPFSCRPTVDPGVRDASSPSSPCNRRRFSTSSATRPSNCSLARRAGKAKCSFVKHSYAEAGSFGVPPG